MHVLKKKPFSVITAYYKEDAEIIIRSINSVKSMVSEKYEINHYLVSDGYPNEVIDSFGVNHLKLNKSHGDYGDTPRLLGAMLAIREGSKGIMFLDADNTVMKNHLLEAEKKYINDETNIVLAKRNFVREDGTIINYVSEEDENYSHVDTGCFIFFDEAIYETLEWAKIPNELSCYGDRYFWKNLRAKRSDFGAIDKPTINYTCLWEGIYKSIGEVPPLNAKSISEDIVPNYLNTLDAASFSRLKSRIKL
jgi:hypothetical protein